LRAPPQRAGKFGSMWWNGSTAYSLLSQRIWYQT
jgi:hypothetical protein